MNKKASKIIAMGVSVIAVCTIICTAFAADGVVEKLVKNNVKENTTITLPVNEPTKDGYSFVGWRLKDVDDGTVYKASDEVKITADMSLDGENVTFIPNWSDYTVKYAVRIYGIKQDEDEAGNKIGLTFGPAGGYGDSDKGEHTYVYCGDGTSGITKNEKYKSCGDNDPTCLHNMTWEEIVQVAKTNPEQFHKCMENRCTKAVPFNITGSIAGTTYAGRMDDCDGASGLYNSIASTYRYWNGTNKTTDGWRDSKIRNTLNGVKTARGSLPENQSLYAMLPQVLKDNIVPKKVISATTSKRSGNNLTTTYDKLWLFSSYEMYKPDGYRYDSTYIDEREGQLYQSQDKLDAVGTSSAGSTTVNSFYSESGSATFLWSRSLSATVAVHFLDDGCPSNNLRVNVANGVAPGFCLGRVTE